MTDNSTRLVVLLADRSGSMWEIKDDAEGGIRAFLASQKDAPGKTLVSLYEFDDEFEARYEFTPLEKIPDYTLTPRGMTALTEAVGTAIARTMAKLYIPGDAQPSEVVFVICTDGDETVSPREYTLDGIKQLVTQLQADKGWKFVFLGVGIDAFAAASNLGIPKMSAMSAGRGQSRAAYASAGHSVLRSSRGEDLKFTDAERDAAK